MSVEEGGEGVGEVMVSQVLARPDEFDKLKSCLVV